MTGPTAESRVLGLFEPGETLTVEQVIERLPEIRWSQVFRAIKVLHERGELLVRARGFRYEMTHARESGAIQSARVQTAINMEPARGPRAKGAPSDRRIRRMTGPVNDLLTRAKQG